MSGLVLRPYQIAGRDFLAARTRALLADEMRVGKTPQAILAAEKAGAEIALVVCPAIAVAHWHREFARWWRRSFPVLYLLVLSYERARKMSDQLKAQHWDVLIVDECHFAKNPTAQRTKMIYGKNGLGYSAERIWALSGTPAPKHAGELWPMLRAFGAVQCSYDEFLRHYCDMTPEGRVVGTKIKFIPELKEILAKVMLRRKRSEVAPEMPAIDFQTLEVNPYILPADMKVPAGLEEDDLLAWLDAHRTADKDNRVAVAQAKAAPLADEIEFSVSNGLLKQCVVFGWHVGPLCDLTEVLRSKGVHAELIIGATSQTDRQRIQEQFRAGEIEVVVANILAAGTAIDLSAASHAYFLELDWVPGNNLQAANRLVSMDKKEPVTVDVVTWWGSTDNKVQSVLMRRVRELSQLM